MSDIRVRLGFVKALLFVCVSLCAITPLWAAGFIVSPTGSDEAVGSEQAPFKTIGKGLSALQPGDTLIITPGVYRESCRLSVKATKEKPVLVKSAGVAGEIMLEPTGADGFVVADSTFVTVEGVKIRAAAENGFVIRNCQNVKLEGCAVADSGKAGIRVSGSDHVTIRACPVSGTKEGHGIHVTSTEHAEVLDCVPVEKNASCGIYLSGAAAEGGDGVMTGASVSRNILKGNGAKGGSVIKLEGVERATIENNVCDKNIGGGIESLKGAGAKAGSRNTFIGNVVECEPGKGTFGIRLADGGSHSTFERNTIAVDSGPLISVDAESGKSFRSSFNFFPVDAAKATFSWKGESMDLAKWQQVTGQDRDSHIGGPARNTASPEAGAAPQETK